MLQMLLMIAGTTIRRKNLIRFLNVQCAVVKALKYTSVGTKWRGFLKNDLEYNIFTIPEIRKRLVKFNRLLFCTLIQNHAILQVCLFNLLSL